MKNKSANNVVKSIKKNVIYFYYKKSDYYKNQCLNLLKNMNSTVINKIKIKKKD